ncbi:MAG: SCE4755 family polysaccharide monooxygenase-like protein [Polyangiaceae bacterium]
MLRTFPLRSLVLALVGAATTIIALPAAAHTVLVNPQPLSTDDNAKTAPCGCTFGSGTSQCAPDYKVTAFTPGQQITVTWNETVNHDGEFRVAFVAKAPQDVTAADFDNATLTKTITDNQAGGLQSTTLTLPSTPCDECTVQVRQFMMGAPSPYYFTCAAVSIGASTGQGGAGGGGPIGTGGDGGAPNTSGPATGPGVGGGEPEWAGPEPNDDGCTTAARSANDAGALLVFAGIGLVFARRRRPR